VVDLSRPFCLTPGSLPSAGQAKSSFHLFPFSFLAFFINDIVWTSFFFFGAHAFAPIGVNSYPSNLCLASFPTNYPTFPLFAARACPPPSRCGDRLPPLIWTFLNNDLARNSRFFPVKREFGLLETFFGQNRLLPLN